MSGEITDYANVDVSASAPAITQAVFKLPLFITHTAAWTEYTREYASLAEVITDFPSATSAEQLAAAAFFSQTPRPTSMIFGRATDHKPTAQFEFTPNVISAYVYKLKIAGQVVPFTSPGSATAAEITAGLKAAIDALSLPVTTSQQAGNTVLRVVATTPGAFVAIGTMDRANLPVVQNHADPGIGIDLASIATERNDWYALQTSFNSDLYVQGAAAYAAANGKLYVAQTIDTVVPRTPLSGTDDVAEFLQNAGNDRVALLYSDLTTDFVDAGLLAARLAKSPGRATWMFAQLSNIPASSFTSTERTNLKAKNCGWYEATRSRAIINQGKLSSGRYIDFRIYLDFFTARSEEKILTALEANDKVGYDDGGISIIAGCMKAQLKEDSTGALAPVDPNSIVITSPLEADTDDTDRENRVINGIQFAFRYTGAIHSANVAGTATL